MLLREALQRHLDGLPDDAVILLRLTIPTQPGLYGSLAADARGLLVLALSGGYSRDEACKRLARDPVMIASFSRALPEGAIRRPDRRAVQRASGSVNRADLRRFGETNRPAAEACTISLEDLCQARLIADNP